MSKDITKRVISDEIIKNLKENIKEAIINSDLNIEEIPDNLEEEIIDLILQVFSDTIKNNNTLYFTLLGTTLVYDLFKKLYDYSGISNLF